VSLSRRRYLDTSCKFAICEVTSQVYGQSNYFLATLGLRLAGEQQFTGAA